MMMNLPYSSVLADLSFTVLHVVQTAYAMWLTC